MAARWLNEIAEAVQHGHDQGVDLLGLGWSDLSIRDDGRAVIADPSLWLIAILGHPGLHGQVSSLAPELLSAQSTGDRRSVI